MSDTLRHLSVRLMFAMLLGTSLVAPAGALADAPTRAAAPVAIDLCCQNPIRDP